MDEEMSAPAIPAFDPDKFMAPRTVNPKATAAFDPDAFMAQRSDVPDPGKQLRNEGFVESAWNMITSPLSVVKDALMPHSLAERRKFAEATVNRVADVMQSGTPEQKQALKDEMLMHFPLFGSTAYKVKEGNIAGAAGDIAGMAALAGLAKGTATAADVVPATVARVKAVAVLPEVRAAAKQVTGIGQAYKIADALEAIRKSQQPPTPGQILAREAGHDWANLSLDDQALLEKIAEAKATAGERFVAPERPPMVPGERITPPYDPNAPRGTTLAEQMAAELAARRATAPPVPTAPAEVIGANIPEVLPQRSVPLRPPLATVPEIITQPATAPALPLPEKIPPAAPAAAAIAPIPVEEPAIPTPAQAAARFVQQREAAQMPVEAAQWGPVEAEAEFQRRRQMLTLPEIQDPGRYLYTESGELKSPQLRGAEIKLRNIELKAQRWANALAQRGYQAADIEHIEPGMVSAEDIVKGTAPGWDNVVHDLIGRGLLKKGEKVPNESIPKVIDYMRQIETQAPAAVPAAPAGLPAIGDQVQWTVKGTTNAGTVKTHGAPGDVIPPGYVEIEMPNGKSRIVRADMLEPAAAAPEEPQLPPAAAEAKIPTAGLETTAQGKQAFETAKGGATETTPAVTFNQQMAAFARRLKEIAQSRDVGALRNITSEMEAFRSSGGPKTDLDYKIISSAIDQAHSTLRQVTKGPKTLADMMGAESQVPPKPKRTRKARQ